MNAEPNQLFYIDNYSNALVIYSAFKTQEVVIKEPYQIFEFYRKLKYRIISMAIHSQKIHSS